MHCPQMLERIKQEVRPLICPMPDEYKFAWMYCVLIQRRLARMHTPWCSILVLYSLLHTIGSWTVQ